MSIELCNGCGCNPGGAIRPSRPAMTISQKCVMSLVAGFIGCAAGCSTQAQDKIDPVVHGSDMLTRSQLESTHARDVYEAVERMRPMWLVSRGVVSAMNPAGEFPVVYLNGVRVGDLKFLKSLRPHEVESILFHSAQDSMTRWGLGLRGGVIEVTMRNN